MHCSTLHIPAGEERLRIFSNSPFILLKYLDMFSAILQNLVFSESVHTNNISVQGASTIIPS